MALAEMQAAVMVPVVKQTVECPSSADFFKPRANIYDLSRIFDKTADEARQVFNLAAKKSVNLLPETCIL